MFYPPIEPLALPIPAEAVQVLQLLIPDPVPAEPETITHTSYGPLPGETTGIESATNEVSGYDGIELFPL